MGHLKDIHSNLDIQTFPGAHFEIEGQVPASQCSEAKIEGTDAETFSIPAFWLTDPGKFTGYDLATKILTITTSPTGNTGNFVINSNDDDKLTLATDPGTSIGVVYYVHDGGELILTQDLQSFAEYIHAAGYAYTIKGGKLFTNMPTGQLKDACTILFDPLT